MLLRKGEAARSLQRIRLGTAEHQGDEREAFIQDLVHDHPDLLPMAEIEPAYSPLIPICRELPTVAGYLDNLWLTPAGGIVLGECKLFRNPEARREVVAQALDYARAVSAMRYDDLEVAVRKALREPSASLWGLVGASTELDEAQFVDAVERRLRQGRFLVLIIGDGIQEGVEALTAHLQLHAGIHVSLALVDLSLWREPGGGLLVLPRIPMRTLLIERGIVVVDKTGAVQISPAPQMAVRREAKSASTLVRAANASEPEFFDQLEQRRPGLAAALRPFLQDVGSLGVEAEFRKSLVLRWDASPDFDASPGYIDSSGKVWLSSGWNAANRLGNPEAGDRYLEAVAALIGGSVKRYEKNWPEVVGANGKTVDAVALLGASSGWRAAMAALIDGLRGGPTVAVG